MPSEDNAGSTIDRRVIVHSPQLGDKVARHVNVVRMTQSILERLEEPDKRRHRIPE